jgi:hypothetical protein
LPARGAPPPPWLLERLRSHARRPLEMMSLHCTPDGRRWDRQSATGLITGAAVDVKWERRD